MATTFVGRNRATNSPGTPFRVPNSSARSLPMYRADRGGDAQQLAGVLRQLGIALNLDESIRLTSGFRVG